MSTVRNDLSTKWLGYEMTQIRKDWKWSLSRWTCMLLFLRGAYPWTTRKKYHMYPSFAYGYQDCGNNMRRQGMHRAPVVAICEGNPMRLHIAASWYLFLPRKLKRLWLLVGGAHPYIPNMLQSSCRNRIVSYTVARWSYYVVLFRTNIVIYRTIPYKLETDRAKL